MASCLAINNNITQSANQSIASAPRSIDHTSFAIQSSMSLSLNPALPTCTTRTHTPVTHSLIHSLTQPTRKQRTHITTTKREPVTTRVSHWSSHSLIHFSSQPLLKPATVKSFTTQASHYSSQSLPKGNTTTQPSPRPL